MWYERNSYKIFGGKPVKKRQLGRPRRITLNLSQGNRL